METIYHSHPRHANCYRKIPVLVIPDGPCEVAPDSITRQIIYLEREKDGSYISWSPLCESNCEFWKSLNGIWIKFTAEL